MVQSGINQLREQVRGAVITPDDDQDRIRAWVCLATLEMMFGADRIPAK
jgi:hypothetical protein